MKGTWNAVQINCYPVNDNNSAWNLWTYVHTERSYWKSQLPTLGNIPRKTGRYEDQVFLQNYYPLYIEKPMSMSLHYVIQSLNKMKICWRGFGNFFTMTWKVGGAWQSWIFTVRRSQTLIVTSSSEEKHSSRSNFWAAHSWGALEWKTFQASIGVKIFLPMLRMK